jgi:hypothetical protein
MNRIFGRIKLLGVSKSLFFFLFFSPLLGVSQAKLLRLSIKDYQDKVQAVWVSQMLGAMMGWPFEHKVASVSWVDSFPKKYSYAPVDDDWYYEMVAIRAFEKYGINMTVKQLGQQWMENSAGTWGSSEQARLLMLKGVVPPFTGEPRYNKLWFTIGSQFSSDVYGAIAPGMPNVAAKIAREYGHINGYAEGADGGVFVAGMISIAFTENNVRKIVGDASKLIDPRSPYRQCLNMVLSMFDKGKNSDQIYNEIEDKWHFIYPATNNAVANGGIVATSLLFGQGDFLKTVNLAYSAADFTDADCNAANAAAVIGAMKGMKCLPEKLVNSLGDKIEGDKMGKVTLTPPVNESISSLAKRTADIGVRILSEHGAEILNGQLTIKVQRPEQQPAELFNLSDFTLYWNPEWKLERAGFGGAGGGMPGIRGLTYLEGDVLSTYPRNEVRGVELTRTLTITTEKKLIFDAGVDSARTWELMVYINNQKVIDQKLQGTQGKRQWYNEEVDLKPYKGQSIRIRLYQKVLVPGKASGNAYWKKLKFL